MKSLAKSSKRFLSYTLVVAGVCWLGTGPLSAQAVAEVDTEEAVDLPSAEQIMAKHIDAIGGREKLAEQKTTVAKGKLKMPEMGLEAELVVRAKEPNRFALEVDLPGAGLIRRATNGEIAWEINPMTGARLIEEKEKKQFMKEADLHAELHPEKYYDSMETVGKVTENGESFYKVKLVNKDGDEETRYYSTETYLLSKMEQVAVTPFGDIDIAVSMGDYRESAGLLVPHKMSQEMMGQKQVFVFDSVEVNVDVDDDTFAVPEEIRELQDS